jgi:hypothetical protein
VILGHAALVVLTAALQAEDDGRRAVVDDADPRGRDLRENGVAGVSSNGALDSPGKARVLEDPLGEDVGLPADLRDDEDLRGCRLAGRPPASSWQPPAARSR